MKLTPWYPPEVKPVREGWYARKLRTDNDRYQYMNYWDGNYWYYNVDGRAKAAANFVGHECHTNHWYWRGLAEEPK